MTCQSYAHPDIVTWLNLSEHLDIVNLSIVSGYGAYRPALQRVWKNNTQRVVFQMPRGGQSSLIANSKTGLYGPLYGLIINIPKSIM